MVTRSNILAWKIPWTEEPGRLHTVHGVTKSWTRLSNIYFTLPELALSSLVNTKPNPGCQLSWLECAAIS